MIELVLAFLRTGLGKYVAGGVAILSCVGAFAFQQQSRGATKAVAKIEKKDAANVSKAQSAATRSRSGSGGVLDPRVRD